MLGIDVYREALNMKVKDKTIKKYKNVASDRIYNVIITAYEDIKITCNNQNIFDRLSDYSSDYFMKAELEEIKEDANTLLYKGMKVELENWENRLYGTLKSLYEDCGYILIGDIYDNGNVQLTYGGACINFYKDTIKPITNEKQIKSDLENKKKELKKLQEDIKIIEKYFNDKE